jgi:hypothetical protein
MKLHGCTLRTFCCRPLLMSARLGLLVAVILGLSASRPALAQDPGYLGNLPTAAQVFARFAGGADPLQTLGRQCAALTMLERRFFRSSAIMTREVEAHPATRRVQQDYADGFAQLNARHAALVGPLDDQKRRTWTAMCENRSTGGLAQPLSTDEVSAVLPASVRAGYEAAMARSDALVAQMRAREEAARQQAAQRAEADARAAARLAAENRQFRWIGLAVLAVGGLVFGWSLRAGYRLGKYEFENRTDGGVVQFTSYGAAIRHSLKGQVLGVVVLVSALTAVAGAVMLVSTL